MDESDRIELKMSKDLSMSFTSLKTRKLGRKISRSMSIVGMKFPERPILIKKNSKIRRPPNGSRKGNWTFDLPIIAPDKTQKQVQVSSSQKVSEAVESILKDFNLQLEKDAKKINKNDGVAIALLGGSRAPVDPNASASLLEGELLILQIQAPIWDGIDLGLFLLTEREYASTVGSAIELYAKPLLNAEILSKREYHVLFYHIHCVSEASKSLCERLQSYMDAGLLNISQKNADSLNLDVENEYQNKSILDEMVQEGFLKASDLDVQDDSSICKNESNSQEDIDEVDAAPSGKHSPLPPKIILSDYDNDMQMKKSNFFTSLPLPPLNNKEFEHRSCCNDPTRLSDNLLINLQWNFIDNNEDGENKKSMNASMDNIFDDYDSVVLIKRSSSDSRILSDHGSENGIYESLEHLPGKEIEDTATPYESIEDLYECLKNQTNESSVDIRVAELKRNDSGDSVKSATTYSNSNSKTSDESNSHVLNGEYISPLFPNRRDSTNDADNVEVERDENTILLNQLLNGDLMDVYTDFLSGYAAAKALLRNKMKSDEHFAALVEIRKGAAKYTIADYLELPIERLAQYERLAGSGDASSRRRGQRLSDLERVQDLFPNDFLALHEHDVVAATAGTLKSKTLLRKRPSLDAALGASQMAAGVPGLPRQFVMEAPCSMTPTSSSPHQNTSTQASPASSPSTSSQDRHLFLFTDLLLVAKSRGNNSFKLKEAVRLSEVWISLGNSDTNFLLGWASSSTPTTYIVAYPTQAARDSWFRKIQNALNTQLEFEPKSTNIQILFKDNTNAIEFSKVLSVSPEMTTAMVIRQALQLVQGGVDTENNTAWGPARDFCLWARASRDSVPLPLVGCERPHAIQMSRIRQTLSNEEGFDLEHVNSKSNPCGMIFELRKINRSVIKTRTPLKLFRRSSGRLFGISLVRLCPNGALPGAVLTMLRIVHRRGPQTQGIFRKSANAKALKHLREKVDNAGATGGRCPELENAHVLLVASLLKDFLRSLPQPLMCDTLYANWISILGLAPAEKLTSMRSLLLKLPKAHYNLLSHFVALLQAIARKSSINLMCPMNLAVCVGPSLLWPTIPCETAPKAVPALIELLISNAEILFGPHLHNIFGKGSPEPSACLSLDSGAEESDSLHSVGLSLDSLDLTCRKEKLSLSRDSGLTLSEDDSNSNGGNSPAPRNGQSNQILPQTGIQMHQAQRVYAKCYTTNVQNMNGLSNPTAGNYDILRSNNVYVKNSELDAYTKKYMNDNMYGTNADIQKTIDNQQKIYDSILVQNRYNSNFHDSQAIYGTQNHTNTDAIVQKCGKDIINDCTPAKYLTGLEPEKPPRLGINRANRSGKVYSMHIENMNDLRSPANRVFCRAKSSDDLLEKRNEKSDRSMCGLKGSQENIYGNVAYDRHQQLQSKSQKNVLNSSKLDSSLQSYSRVYGGWEQRVLNYTNHNSGLNVSDYTKDTFKCSKPVDNNESIYDIAPSPYKTTHNGCNLQDCENKSSTIFTRKDWSRQASRTKSLDVNNADCSHINDMYQDEENDETVIYKTVGDKSINAPRSCNSSSILNGQCNRRSMDPAHVCSKKCALLNGSYIENENSEMIQNKQTNKSINSSNFKNNNYKPQSMSEVKKISSTPKNNPRKLPHNSKYEKHNHNNKLVHSKSLANIVFHSNSNNNDTSLYQSSNYSNKYGEEFADTLYDVPPVKTNLNTFCENMYGKMGTREGIYSSDIYTAKPTSINSYNPEIKTDTRENTDKIEYSRSNGVRNVPNAPPVPPRKASHNNSALKNLPPVHLVNDDRKLKSKSVSSIYQEKTKDFNRTIHDDKNLSGLRAPITSYQIGKSTEKFILALEDSGSDTESESYV